jgi:hypothetical protein
VPAQPLRRTKTIPRIEPISARIAIQITTLDATATIAAVERGPRPQMPCSAYAASHTRVAIKASTEICARGVSHRNRAPIGASRDPHVEGHALALLISTVEAGICVDRSRCVPPHLEKSRT